MLLEFIENLALIAQFFANWRNPLFASNLTGDMMISMDGQFFMGFEGIRYAQPPVGELRFKDPVPIEKLEFLKKKVECLELDPAYYQIIGQEDCLFLNVYTSVQFTNKLMPVLVWIHGSPFRFGSSQQGIYQPHRLIDQGMIVVTMSYRLGPLGFASLGHKDFSGNFGLKDQKLAIQWVLKNIERFGGDSDRVTIGGEGLGAAYVQHHMNGELSRRIKRVISIGGSRLAPWALMTTDLAKNRTEWLAHELRCETCNGSTTISEPVKFLYETKLKNGSRSGTVIQSATKTTRVSCERMTADCLRFVDASTIVKTVSQMRYSLSWDRIVQPFRPIMDGEMIAYDYWNSSRENNYTSLLGVNHEEGAFIITLGKRFDWGDSEFKQAFEELSKKGFERMSFDPSVYKELMRLYNGKTPKDRLADFITDAWFMHPVISEVKRNKGTTYGFMFNHPSELDHAGCTVLRETTRASYGDQMPFMFFVFKCGADYDSYELFARNYTSVIGQFVRGREPELSTYSKDHGLFTITLAIYRPALFSDFDQGLAGRLQLWKYVHFI